MSFLPSYAAVVPAFSTMITTHPNNLPLSILLPFLIYSSLKGDVEAMPTASMKPTSRLLLRVLGEEAKKDSPFAAPLDIKALLVDIHGTYGMSLYN